MKEVALEERHDLDVLSTIEGRERLHVTRESLEQPPQRSAGLCSQRPDDPDAVLEAEAVAVEGIVGLQEAAAVKTGQERDESPEVGVQVLV